MIRRYVSFYGDMEEDENKPVLWNKSEWVPNPTEVKLCLTTIKRLRQTRYKHD